ncbi:HAMP domain-containing histidine kinase (plasmid) [Mesorhizobium loti]|nr:HAMP domain-containing histidine kinase [Mesorhizobium loti]
MKKPHSMTRRLILRLGGATLLVWIFVPTIAALMVKDVIYDICDDYLEQTAEVAASAYVDVAKKKFEVSEPPSFDDWIIQFQVRTRDGKVLLDLIENPPKPFPSAPLREGFSTTATDRIYTKKIALDLFAQAAQPLSVRRHEVNKAAVKVFVPMIVFLPFSVAVCWMVIRRSLAPIEVLKQEIGLRDGGNLTLMGSSGLPAELAPIAASVDRLVERLRAALDAEREFAANCAHELRTPIAGSLAQLQRLVAEIPLGSARTRARGIEKSLSRLGHLTEKLLQLARAESGIGIADHAIDLVRVVRLEIDDFEKKPRFAGRLILDVDGCPTLMRKVDVDAFAIILRNLIENALTHGVPDTTITVSVGTDGTIAIANSGPVVPPKILKR